MPKIAGHKCCAVRKSNACDKQIGTTNLSIRFHHSELIKLRRSRAVKRCNKQMCQEVFRADQELMRSHDISSRCRLEEKVNTTTHQLNPCNYGGANLWIVGRLKLPYHIRIASIQMGQGIGVEQIHALLHRLFFRAMPRAINPRPEQV